MAASSSATSSSMTRIQTPDVDSVKTFFNAALKYIKSEHLTPKVLSQKIKFIIDADTGECLSTIMIDVGRMIRTLVEDGSMSSSEKIKSYQDAGLILTYNINAFLSSVQELSSDVTPYGWKFKDVKVCIYNPYRFNGLKKDKDGGKGKASYGAGEFSLILTLDPDTSMRLSPVCNNTMRDETPMRVSGVITEVSDTAASRDKKRNKEEGASRAAFKTPHPTSRAVLTAPNSAYVEHVASLMSSDIQGGGFAGSHLKYIVDREGKCLTNKRIDFSFMVKEAVRRYELPASFFRITQNDYGKAVLPSDPAQKVVRDVTCEESLRFLSNFSAIVNALCDKVEVAFPTIGWRARDFELVVYDPERFFGFVKKTKDDDDDETPREVIKGGSSTSFVIALEPLRKDLEGLICCNTAAEGCPMVKSSKSMPTGSWASKAAGGGAVSAASSSNSGVSVHKTYAAKPVTSGVTGRRK